MDRCARPTFLVLLLLGNLIWPPAAASTPGGKPYAPEPLAPLAARGPAGAPGHLRVTGPDPLDKPFPWNRLALLPADELPRAPEGRGLVPLCELPGWVVAGLEGTAWRDLAGPRWRVFAAPEPGEVLVAERVVPEAAPPRGWWAELGGGWRLRKGPRRILQEKEGIAARRVVFPRPLRRPAPERRRALQPLERDPWIAQRVQAVSTDSLAAYANHLSALPTRESSTPGGRAAQEWLEEKFRSFGYEDVWTYDYNDWCDDVVARKEGAVRPEEIVLLGAHYDSFSRDDTAPGADDNASGTSGLLEVARLMAGATWERTLVFVAFSGEEQGLVGSEAFAQWARSRDWQIVAMINLDMLGYVHAGDRRDLDLIFREEERDLFGLVAAAGSLYVADLPVVEGHLVGGNSDHSSFWGNGYRAVFFFEDSDHPSPYIHTAADVVGLSLNDFDFMTRCVGLALATAAVLAGPRTLKIFHEPLPEDVPLDAEYPVVLDLRSETPVDAGGVHLAYRVDGGAFVEVAMVFEGPGEAEGAARWRASIPSQPVGSVVEYYLEAQDVQGHVVRDPQEAPEQLYRFYVGYERLLESDFETPGGWERAPEGEATSGLWEWAEPESTGYQPGADHTPGEGTRCWVTGAAAGEEPGANDVDGGATFLVSPPVDLQGYRRVEFSFWLWYVDAVRPDDSFLVQVSAGPEAGWLTVLEVADQGPGWRRLRIPDVEQAVDLGPETRWRFVAQDIGYPSLVEALVDDVLLRAAPPEDQGVPDPNLPPEAQAVRLEAGPLPVTETSWVRFVLPRDGAVEMDLVDVLGRRRGWLLRETLPAGVHLLPLAGLLGGRHLPSGAYWVRLRAPSGTARLRLVVLH
jgi:hypothetical protein